MQPETLAEQILFSTVRIVTDSGIGTSFFFRYNYQSVELLFLVTNKHVVANTKTIRISLAKAHKDSIKLGEQIEIEITNMRWFGHPDENIDVCILPFDKILSQIHSQGIETFMRAFAEDNIPNDSQLKQLDAIEEVTFIGYPIGLYDTYNLLPLTRKGFTATHPQINYENLPAFLIDAAVFPGSSGSPVLIANFGHHTHRGIMNLTSRFYLLGIISHVFIMRNGEILESNHVPLKVSDSDNSVGNQLINIGLVMKSSTVVETIEYFFRTNQIVLNK